MKKTIILIAVMVISSVVYAHDPNSLPADKDVRWEVTNQSIVTFDIRLPARFVKILAKLSPADVTKTVTQMVMSWEHIFRAAFNKSLTDKDMGL